MTSIAVNSSAPQANTSNASTSSSTAHARTPSVSSGQTSSAAVTASAPAPRALSYANVVNQQKKLPTGPGAASSPSNPASQVSGGVPQHARAAQGTSTAPVNGKIQPAVPQIGNSGNSVANGASSTPYSGGQHSRKSSIATGAMPNGALRAPNIKFGTLNEPGSGPQTSGTAIAAGNLTAPVAQNPRASSPSPSAAAQPAASGGAPPSASTARPIQFGDTTPQQRPVSLPPQPHPPQGPNSMAARGGHNRHESAQDTAPSMSHGRGMPQTGRGGGRHPGGYQQGQYQNQQYGGYGRGGYQGPAQSRNGGNMGAAAPYVQQQQYPGSPRAVPRSPALSHVSVQHSPSMAAAIPATTQLYPPPHAHGQPFIPQGSPQVYPVQQIYPDVQYSYHQQYQMGGYSGYPPTTSPRPHYSQTVPQMGAGGYPYVQQGAAPMSRSGSQNVDNMHRPPSSIGQHGQPPMAPQPHHIVSPPQQTPGLPQGPYRPPAKKVSKALEIKNPSTGTAVKIEQPKPAAPPVIASSAPIIVSSPSPVPGRASSRPEAPHSRSTSRSNKSNEEKRQEMREKVKKAEEEGRRREEEAKKAAEEERKRKEEEAEKSKVEAEARAKAEAEEKAKREAEIKAEAEAKAKAEAAEAKAKAEAAEARAKAEAEAEARAKAEREAEEKRLKAEAEAKAVAEAAAAAAAAEKEAREKAAKAAAEEKAKREAEEKAAREAKAAKEAKAKEAADAAAAKAKAEAEAQVAKAVAEAKAEAEKKASAISVDAPIFTPKGAPDSESMPPPSLKTMEKARTKPSPLNLQIKTNEAGPPSAQLTALRSARPLENLKSLQYPEGIQSPNPALNPAANTFKYDKDFLMQFQHVFTEKPSVDWDQKMRETVGDTEMSRPGTARAPPGGMGSRSSSRGTGGLSTFGGGVMGNFVGAGVGSKSAASLNSMDRFNKSSSSNPLAMIGSLGMSRPGAGLVRANSSTSLTGSGAGAGSNALPQSPRTGNRSARGNSRRGQPGGAPMERSDSRQSTGPTIPLADVKPLPVSANRWTPRSVKATAEGSAAASGAGPAASPAAGAGGDLMPPEMVQRKVKAALNKMTPEKFDKISDQILEITGQSKHESDGRTLRQVIQLTFEKACDEAHWASMYAKFCKRMLETMDPSIKDENIKDKNLVVVTGGNLFRKYLLNRCQEEFERGWKVNLPPRPEGVSEEVMMLSDEYYIAAAAKRRGLGLVQFIGELFKLGMLTERIMNECVRKLLDFEGIPEDETVESLSKLLRTIGAQLDASERSRPMMDMYFTRIDAMINHKDLNSRMRFMLMDIMELRTKKRWESKETDKGPKTIQEVREEALKAQQEKEAVSKANRSNRPQAGRGDARSFSQGGYGNMSQSYHDNKTAGTVNMDDLRKLGARSRQTSSGPQSFGPSMLGPRGSGSRRGLGPNVNRGDDGPGSRTATPPVPASTSSPNPFSALLEAPHHDGHEATSPPPSNANSPQVSNAKPVTDEA